MEQVRLQADGVKSVRLSDEQLVFTTAVGNFIFPSLDAEDTNSNTPVSFTLIPQLDSNSIVFRLPSSNSYAHTSTVLPSNLTGLLYGTFLGGSLRDESKDIAVNAAGNVYVTGRTYSANFPTTPGTFDPAYNGGGDAFVAKFSPNGSSLIYATFLGGNDADVGYGVVADGDGNVHLTGETYSINFPTTGGAFDLTHNGDYDVFVVKLNSTGNGLLYATFLGGSNGDTTYSVAIDGTNNAYVSGITLSSNFPTTPGSFDHTYNGGNDVFVVKFTPAGNGLVYATFLGGDDHDNGWNIAIDAVGNAYVIGGTWSINFPVVSGAFDPTYNGNWDAFMVKLDTTGSNLIYSTFLGGDDRDYIWDIAIDDIGNAYTVGGTLSVNFPTTSGVFNSTYNGGGDAFIVKLNPTGSELTYSTFIGGNADDGGLGIALNEADNAFTVGYTNSANFPTSLGAFDPTYNGGDYDIFVVKLNSIGSELAYSTFIGGNALDLGEGIAIDGTSIAFIAGTTNSPNFPTTSGAFDSTPNGGDDAFVVKLFAVGTNELIFDFLPLMVKNP